MAEGYHIMIKALCTLDSVEEMIEYFSKRLQSEDKKTLYNQIVSVRSKLDDLYYNDGTTPLTDKQYDLLLETIILQFSEFNSDENDKTSVGYAVNKGDAVELPHFMASMNKFKTIAEITRWKKTFGAPYTVTAKLDGISGMYHNGKLYTRGNGTKGRDISFLIPFLNIPSEFNFAESLNNSFALRGELIIKKSVFDSKYKDKYANARNLVCGLLNRNYSDEYIELYGDIDFVVYDLYHYNPLQFCNKVNMIVNASVNFVIYKNNVLEINLDNLNNILNSWKEEYDYEIDGIIITNNEPCIHPTDGNPDFAFAYKNNVIGVEVKEGIVDKVIWNISKDNYLKPKIKLVESVCCNGSNIEYVTGFNAKYIFQNEIAPGTKLRVGLSGNVIPYIFEVVGVNKEMMKNIDLPFDDPKIVYLLNNLDCQAYSWNKNKVDLISAETSNPYVKIKQNAVFFNTFGLKCSLQETTLINVYETLGLFHLSDILSLNQEQWCQVEKVASKKAEKIVNGVHDVLDWNMVTKDKTKSEIEQLSHDYLIHYLTGLLCFPRGFAKKKIQCHLKYLLRLSSYSVIDISQLYDPVYVSSIQKAIVEYVDIDMYKVNQVTCDSIGMFCEGLLRFITTYNQLRQDVQNIDFPNIKYLISNGIMVFENKMLGPGLGNGDDKNPKKGMNIVFSGVRDKKREAELVESGYTISDVVNNKTHLLIVNDLTSTSSKVKKAQKLGVTIATLEQLSSVL